ncbi:HTTM domain-containing protein [Haloferax namakaokahaiae]|uniref:HTTM domain-containing protein n=1 Tax=Haloferax namakaokahaiae TaxID=1748331 RepID=A0ABD5ZBG5_9EURY
MTRLPVSPRVRRALASRVAIDARALAAFRIALGFVILLDLLLRARNLSTFYTDAGVFPRAAAFEVTPTIGPLSLHALSGSLWLQALLFVVAGAFAVALIAGYRTKFVTLVSLVFLLSLHVRNLLVLNSGDLLLERLLFWGLFLPLGRRWSVDARRRSAATVSDATPERIVSVASAGLLLQVVFVYTVTGLFKLQHPGWLRGEEIRIVLHLETYTTAFGRAVGTLPLVSEVATWLWLGLLVASASLVLLTGRRRTALTAVFASIHVGMLVMMTVGMFPLISLAALVPFLHADVWDRLERALADAGIRTAGTAASGRDGNVVSDGGATTTRLRTLGRNALRVGLVCCLVVMVLWNGMTLGYVPAPEPVAESAASTDYTWPMFASPPTFDTRYAVIGETTAGEEVVAFPQTDRSVEETLEHGAAYETARWRKYLTNMRMMRVPVVIESFSQHVCDHWDETHDTELERVSLTLRKFDRAGENAGGSRTETLATSQC